MAKGIKTGGRSSGTPNKLTYQTRQVLVNALADEFTNLPELFAQLDPAQRIDAICKLSKYVLPTMMPTPVFRAEENGLEDSTQALEKIKDKHAMDALLSM